MNQPLNTPAEVMVAQATENLLRDLPVFIEQEAHKAKVCIVGGGPSLADTLPALRFQKDRGALVMALNGTHDWLIERGIVPDMHVMLDARKENVEFVSKPNKAVTYLIAAQCHPRVFDALSASDVLVWVADVPGMRELADRVHKPLGLVGGGSTVGLKAMALAYLWGFRSIALFGMDSCYRSDAHHAYPQALNDGESRVDVLYGGKRFSCATWMHAQAEEFEHDLQQLLELGCAVKTFGTGLIQTINDEIQRRNHAAA